MSEDRVPWFQRAVERLAGHRRVARPPAFVELPLGLFTASGTWFHVSQAELESYAGDVLARVPLDRLVPEAETMLRSPQTLTLWVVLVGLLAGSPWQAAALGGVVLLAWSSLMPGFVTLPFVRAFRVMESVPLQGFAFIAVLSWLGTEGRLLAVGIGLAAFVLLRWGIAERIARPLVDLLRRPLYRLPLPDQVLRAVIVRHALAERVPVSHVEEMESSMLERARRRGRPR